jgi:DNA-binding CsgD family transcriptional regulator
VSTPLSAGEITALERAMRVVLAPHSHPDAVSWSVEVCEAARGLAGGAVQSSVYLEGGERLALVHTTLDPARTRDYFAHYWREDSAMREIVRRRLPVAHALMVCSEDEYYRSALYHDYMRPNGVDLSVGVSAYGADGRGPRLMLTYEQRPSLAQVERVTALLGVLAPAFVAGAARWQGAHAGAPAMAAVAGPVLVCDAAGRVLHETPALGALLAGAPGAAAVRVAARSLAAAAAVLLRRAAALGDVLAALDGARRTVRTAGGTYGLRCTLAPDGVLGGQAALVVAVDGPAATRGASNTFASTTPAPGTFVPAATAPSAAARDAARDAAADRFGLTPQELAVAQLMAERRTDAEIGAALGISPNTARTHAERVRRKLRVARRTEVAAALGRG